MYVCMLAYTSKLTRERKEPSLKVDGYVCWPNDSRGAFSR